MASKVKFGQHPHRGNASNKSLVLSSFGHLSLGLPHKVTTERVYEAEIQEVIRWLEVTLLLGRRKWRLLPHPVHDITKLQQDRAECACGGICSVVGGWIFSRRIPSRRRFL